MYNFSKIIRNLSVIAVFVLAARSINASAQNTQGSPELRASSKGEIHLSEPVKVGNTILQPGMYQVQHVVTAADHAVEFKKVEMAAGYRHGSTWVVKEAAARVTCNFQPATKKSSNTRFTLRTNAAGQRELAELQIAGEPFLHQF